MEQPYRIDLAALRGERVAEAYGRMAGLDAGAHREESVAALLRALWHSSCAGGTDLRVESQRGILTLREDVQSALRALEPDAQQRERRAQDLPSAAEWERLAEQVRTHYRTAPEIPPLRIDLEPPMGPRALAEAGDLVLALHRTICTEEARGPHVRRLLADLYHLGSWHHVDIPSALDRAYMAFRRDLLTTRPHLEAGLRAAEPTLADALDDEDVPSAGEWHDAVTWVEDALAREARLRAAEDTAPVTSLDDALFGDGF